MTMEGILKLIEVFDCDEIPKELLLRLVRRECERVLEPIRREAA